MTLSPPKTPFVSTHSLHSQLLLLLAFLLILASLATLTTLTTLPILPGLLLFLFSTTLACTWSICTSTHSSLHTQQTCLSHASILDHAPRQVGHLNFSLLCLLIALENRECCLESLFFILLDRVLVRFFVLGLNDVDRVKGVQGDVYRVRRDQCTRGTGSFRAEAVQALHVLLVVLLGLAFVFVELVSLLWLCT